MNEKALQHTVYFIRVKVLTESPEILKDENVILDLCYDINLKYNILIDAHILSKKEIKSIRGKQSIFVNALKAVIHA